MTPADLDNLEALIAASEQISPTPWGEDVDGDIADWRDAPVVLDTDSADRSAVVALRNAAPTLIALAREGLASEARVARLTKELAAEQGKPEGAASEGWETSGHMWAHRNGEVFDAFVQRSPAGGWSYFMLPAGEFVSVGGALETMKAVDAARKVAQ